MRAEDVTNTIELALAASGCDQAVVRHMPRLLSDNGSCYISGRQRVSGARPRGGIGLASTAAFSSALVETGGFEVNRAIV